MNIDQKLLNELKREMIYSDEDTIEEYYGVQINVYKNLDKYLMRVISQYDKISLAQWANNYEKVNELIAQIQLPEEQRKKYNRLLLNNADLNETIDLRILMPKYDFLNDILDMIVTNRDVQEQLLSLSDDKLEIFKLLYSRLMQIENYCIPHITSILCKMGTITPFTSWQNQFYRYSELEESIIEHIKKGLTLSEEEIDNLLYLYTTNIAWNVKNYKELSEFTLENGIFFNSINHIISQQEKEEKKDIRAIKNALLLKCYGIDLTSAISICGRYDLSSIQMNQENVDLFEMYMAMVSIINEQDPDLLLDVYKEFAKEMNPRPNFMRTIVFENALRKEFALNLNSVVYKCGETAKVVDDVPVFEAGTDFKMIVTAIGAYQSSFESQKNYKEYWNMPTIRSHGNCCSLIANNNLSMANPKNVIFGFSTMDESMLLLSSSKDINSTPTSKRFNIAQEEGNGSNITIEGKEINSIGRIGLGIEFTNPEILIDNTRGDYNELVYERRDLSSNPLYYKKNPDYIVFIEEYENIDFYLEYYKNDPEKLAYLKEQERVQQFQWQESTKAAKDFGIPIVKINREKCAKESFINIKQLLQQFENTKDPSLISSIICEFENNRVGNNDRHAIIREKYFSKDNMNEILNRIESIILSLPDDNDKNNLLSEYYNSILKEQAKVKRCSDYRNNGQTSGIDFDIVINRIQTMANFEIQSQTQSEIVLPIRR